MADLAVVLDGTRDVDNVLGTGLSARYARPARRPPALRGLARWGCWPTARPWWRSGGGLGRSAGRARRPPLRTGPVAARSSSLTRARRKTGDRGEPARLDAVPGPRRRRRRPPRRTNRRRTDRGRTDRGRTDRGRTARGRSAVAGRRGRDELDDRPALAGDQRRLPARRPVMDARRLRPHGHVLLLEPHLVPGRTALGVPASTGGQRTSSWTAPCPASHRRAAQPPARSAWPALTPLTAALTGSRTELPCWRCAGTVDDRITGRMVALDTTRPDHQPPPAGAAAALPGLRWSCPGRS